MNTVDCSLQASSELARLRKGFRTEGLNPRELISEGTTLELVLMLNFVISSQLVI